MSAKLPPIRTALTCAFFTALLAAPAWAQTITGDPGHSLATFSVKHLAISTVSGTVPFLSWSGTCGDDLIPTGLSAVMDAKAIDSKNPDRDAQLRGKQWFNTDVNPTFTFKSTKIVPGPGGTFKATGDLTMNGITKPATFDGKLEGSLPGRNGGKRVGYSAITTVDRRQFGLNFDQATPGGNLVVDYNVTLSIQAEGEVEN
jgi:polyisoprenoid-binding protein YceI